MKKNAVQHKKEVNLSIAVVQLNTMIRYMFSEHYRILKISTYRRGEFHFDYLLSKKELIAVVVDFYLFFFRQCIEKKLNGKKQRRKHFTSQRVCKQGGRNATIPLYKKK